MAVCAKLEWGNKHVATRIIAVVSLVLLAENKTSSTMFHVVAPQECWQCTLWHKCFSAPSITSSNFQNAVWPARRILHFVVGNEDRFISFPLLTCFLPQAQRQRGCKRIWTWGSNASWLSCLVWDYCLLLCTTGSLEFLLVMAHGFSCCSAFPWLRSSGIEYPVSAPMAPAHFGPIFLWLHFYCFVFACMCQLLCPFD